MVRQGEGGKKINQLKMVDISRGKITPFESTYLWNQIQLSSSYKETSTKHGILAMSAFCGHKIGFICTRYKNVNIAK